ncbi:MAG: hypothetical protein ACP5K9_01265 [Candidatus Micrarchaeia archaeon]
MTVKTLDTVNTIEVKANPEAKTLVAQRIEELKDKVSKLDKNSSEQEIRQINSEVVGWFSFGKTLQEEGVTGKGVDALNAALFDLNEAVAEAANRLGRDVEKVQIESMGPKVHHYIRAQEGSAEESAALKELHSKYLENHTKNGSPKHYDLYEFDSFKERAAMLKKMLLSYGDLGVSIAAMGTTKEENDANSGNKKEDAAYVIGKPVQNKQEDTPQNNLQVQNNQNIAPTPYTVSGQGVVVKEIMGSLEFSNYINDMTALSEKATILRSKKTANKEYSEQEISKALSMVLGGIYDDLKNINEFAKNSSINTKFLSGLLSELESFNSKRTVSADVKHFIDSELSRWEGYIKEYDLKTAVSMINRDIRDIARFVNEAKPGEIGRLEAAVTLDSASKMIKKEESSISEIAKAMRHFRHSTKKTENKVLQMLDAADKFWIAEQVYALMASRALLEVNAAIRSSMLSGNRSESAVKEDMLNVIAAFKNAQ